MLSLCADVWLYRCAVSGRVESEFADSFGGGAEGTAALEGHRWSQRPSAQRLRLSGVAVLPEPRALLPHVRLTYTPFMFRVTIQDTLVLLDHSESALVRKVTWKCFFFFLVLYVIVVCILFHEGAVVLTQPAPAEWHWALPAAVNRRSLQQWLFERCSTHSVSAMLQRVPQHSHTHTKSTNQSLLEKYFHFMDILAIRYTVVVMLRRFLLCLFYYVWHLGLLLWVNEKSNGLSHCRWCLKSF